MKSAENQQRKKRVMNPKSLENLKPYKKGETGNDKGRVSPNRKTLFEKWIDIEESVDNIITGKKEKLTQLDQIAIDTIDKAKKGSAKDKELILDALFGVPKQTIETTNIEPLKVIIETPGTAEKIEKIK